MDCRAGDGLEMMNIVFALPRLLPSLRRPWRALANLMQPCSQLGKGTGHALVNVNE